MTIETTELKSADKLGSGRVRRFLLPDGKTSITQISTFCPDTVGPGPVNVYVIESDIVTLLDAGIPTHLAKAFFYHWRNQPIPPEVEALPGDQSARELRQGLELAGYSVSDIALLAISHGHPDHFMMASSILNDTDAAVAAHILDTPAVCNPWGLLNMWVSRQDQMAATGMPAARRPEELAGEAMVRGVNLESLGVDIKVDSPVMNEGPLNRRGSRIEGVEVRHLPGHSPGSIGLMVGKPGSGRVLLCGDVLLNPITPHPDDLLVYLQTLEALENYDDVALVLPAHGAEITDLKARVVFLKEHHRNRLRHTFEECRAPRCVWEVATSENYFDTYVDPKKFNFLAGLEALVHLELLNMVGGLVRTHIKGPVHYFVNSGEPFEQVYGRIMDLVTNKNAVALMRY
ncbi:MAG: MBL fold metallo-hydrolase [Desulfomonile tiedjei]|nr:MBL fold metallo-hydrolase [Desulfomonile tiedjei]